MVWYVAEAVDGDLKVACERLNGSQPAAYRIWERFRDLDSQRAFTALVHLCRLRQPAELRDWEALVA